MSGLNCLNCALDVYNSDACSDVKIAAGRAGLRLAEAVGDDALPHDVIDQMSDIFADLGNLLAQVPLVV
jgi:hypothetical protein